MTTVAFAPGALDDAGRVRRLAPGAPRHRRRPADRPAEIAEAVWTLIQEIGPDRLTMTEAAARAGLSRGGLTRYFPTKAALCRAALGAGPTKSGRSETEEAHDDR